MESAGEWLAAGFARTDIQAVVAVFRDKEQVVRSARAVGTEDHPTNIPLDDRHLHLIGKIAEVC